MNKLFAMELYSGFMPEYLRKNRIRLVSLENPVLVACELGFTWVPLCLKQTLSYPMQMLPQDDRKEKDGFFRWDLWAEKRCNPGGDQPASSRLLSL